MTKAIEIENLSVSYSDKEVLTNINLTVEIGKLVGIVGPNGAGKSTLIKAILGLVKKDQGEVKIFGKDLDEVRENLAYVPQRSDIDWDFPITVKDSVLIGTYPKLGLLKRPGKKEKDLAMASLEKVGMEESANKQISQLSGGQQQRIFIARALAQEAECYFLDEPFVGVDATSEEIIIDILRELRNRRKTIFIIHHDLAKAESYFDDLILINKKIVGYGSVESIFDSELIQTTYESPVLFTNTMGGE